VAGSIQRTIGWIANGGGSFTVGYAAAGDTNLDGIFDIQDVSNFVAAGQLNTASLSDWEQGDFNHDGLVDIIDVADMVSSELYGAGPYLPSAQAASFAATPQASGASANDLAFAALASETTVGTGRKKSVFAVI